jgi:protein ImuB
MFACIHARSVSKTPGGDDDLSPSLTDLAFTFSPLVERTTADTIVFDIGGQDLLFGGVTATNSAPGVLENIANAITQRARQLRVSVNVAIAANPDAAIHAARSLPSMTIIDAGDELRHLGQLSIAALDGSLAGVDAHKAAELYETFAMWGIGTFRELASLPLSGVAERLGQEGVRFQKLAQGRSRRTLNLIRPPAGFTQSLQLEHPVSEFEPLSFILARLLNQLCANLNEHALATNELRLRLLTEQCPEYRLQPQISGDHKKSPAQAATPNLSDLQERTITLPVPMRDPRTLLRLLLFDIEAHPPPAPITAVAITAEPVKPRASQTGLFIPLAPEPEKLEITLARLVKLVGPENVGSPELLDTHRPDVFRMNRFTVQVAGKRKRSNRPSSISNRQCVMGFRTFRPPWRAEVETSNGQPARINARTRSSGKVAGKITRAAGPWRASGDWWRVDVWARDEWDIAVMDRNQESEIICRIYRDLTNEQWFVAGIYD